MLIIKDDPSIRGIKTPMISQAFVFTMRMRLIMQEHADSTYTIYTFNNFLGVGSGRLGVLGRTSRSIIQTAGRWGGSSLQ